MASSDNENHASNLVNDQRVIEEKEKEAAPAAAEGGGGGGGTVEVEYWRYIPLQEAALRGDWETAKKFFDQDDNGTAALKGAKITQELETVFHVAVNSGRSIDFVKKLLDLMPMEALRLIDSCGRNALHIAAMVGNTKAAVILVQKHSASLYMRDMNNWLPIHWAANKGHKETLLYLLRVTEDDPISMPFAYPSGVQLLIEVVASTSYDVALSLVSCYPHLARSRLDDGRYALAELAYIVSSFPSGTRLNCWEGLIYYYWQELIVRFSHPNIDALKIALLYYYRDCHNLLNYEPFYRYSAPRKSKVTDFLRAEEEPTLDPTLPRINLVRLSIEQEMAKQRVVKNILVVA